MSHTSSSIALFGAAGEARQLRAPGVAQHVHEEQPVLGADVARAEQRVRARGAVDVRNAEARVADHDHAGARAVGALLLADRDAEAARP